MNFRDLTLGAYTKLHDSFSSEAEPPLVQFLGFEYASESNDFIYSLQEQDFTRELVNSFNQFAYWLERIKLWEKVLAAYNDEDREELRYEFTKLPLDYCLHFPYQFKSRLIFCATQLCYTRGVSTRILTKADVELDEKINFASLIRISAHWAAARPLVESLREVDAEPYREGTLNYRNKSQHRHGPRLDFGHIANIGRDFPEGFMVAYSFGQTPPLMATDLLPVLAGEAERLRHAFWAYRELIADHCHTASKA